MSSTTTLEASIPVISSAALLNHWQGHRRLTRRVIEAFPEDKLFSYSVGGMRPFSVLALEILDMATPGISGVVTGKWQKAEEMSHISNKSVPTSKQELLDRWDETTTQLDELWSQIKPERFMEEDTAFGQWPGTIYWFILYFIDNEIHHRAQGYVYLRTLGIEPPAFWDRN